MDNLSKLIDWFPLPKLFSRFHEKSITNKQLEGSCCCRK